MEPTHGDEMTDVHTAESVGGGAWVWEADALSRVVCVFMWEPQRYVCVWVPAL